MDGDEMERLIAAARPPRPSDDPAVLAALDELRLSLVPRRHRRRWSRLTVVAALAAATVVVTTGAAILIGARTGWFTPPSSEQNASEWLNTGAVDFPREVRKLAPSYVSYPAGTTADDASAWVAGSETKGGGLVQEISIVRGFENFAQCSWVDVWQSVGPETTARARATTAISKSTDWPALRATDGGGVREAMEALAAAAKSGDAAGVAHQADILCPSELLSEQ